MRTVYENCMPLCDTSNQKQLTIILGKYAHMAAVTLDQEMNLSAALLKSSPGAY